MFHSVVLISELLYLREYLHFFQLFPLFSLLVWHQKLDVHVLYSLVFINEPLFNQETLT